MAVSKRLRHEVMRRDNHTCRYCGATAPDVKLTIDHVTPTTLGGSDEPSNLVTACADCNAGKSATPPGAALVADVDQRAAEHARALEIAIQHRAAELATLRETVDQFDQAWQSWADGAIEREGNWRSSIERFVASGLDARFLVEAVETAMGNRRLRTRDVWRYFCGICWTEIKKTQDLVAQIFEGAEPPTAVDEIDRPQFDFMCMTDAFIGDLVTALGGDEQVAKFVHHALWNVMPDAHAEWRRRLSEPGEDFDPAEQTVDEYATEIALDYFTSSCAPYMYELGQWRKARDAAHGS